MLSSPQNHASINIKKKALSNAYMTRTTADNKHINSREITGPPHEKLLFRNEQSREYHSSHSVNSTMILQIHSLRWEVFSKTLMVTSR